MAVKVAINGFGRIGRLVFRAIAEQGLLGKELDVVAVGDIVPADNLAYLLKYDSIQGRFAGTVGSRASTEAVAKAKAKAQAEGKKFEEPDHDILTVNGCDMRLVSARSPAELPWKAMGVDLVIESTGLFTDAEKCKGHLAAGAKKVVITAPGKGDDITIVMGVNHDKYDPKAHHIISNASCTTNCLAPLVHVLLKEGFGIEEGLMTTIHSYTATQKTVDGPSKKDWKGGRSAAINLIPSTTGAARAVGLVLPHLKGKLDGFSLRVPAPDGSCTDLTAIVGREVTVEEVNAAFKEAAAGRLKGILEFCEDPIVSMDVVGNPASSVIDAALTMADGTMVKTVSWYDNEWGYTSRLIDLTRLVL